MFALLSQVAPGWSTTKTHATFQSLDLGHMSSEQQRAFAIQFCVSHYNTEMEVNVISCADKFIFRHIHADTVLRVFDLFCSILI